MAEKISDAGANNCHDESNKKKTDPDIIQNHEVKIAFQQSQNSPMLAVYQHRALNSQNFIGKLLLFTKTELTCLTPMSAQEKINYRLVPDKAEMWSDTDGISWLVFAIDSEIDEQDVRTISNYALQDDPSGVKFLVLVDIRNISMITSEARTYASSREMTNISKAVAIVVGSPATRLIANFFIRFHKPLIPSKIFTSTKEAKQWLLKMK